MLHFTTNTPGEMHPADGGASGYFHAYDVDFTAHLPEHESCAHCSEEITEYAEGWLHDETNSRYCDQAADPAESVNMDDEDELQGWLHEGGYEADTVAAALEEWNNDHDQATPLPSAPGNWVGFTIDPDSQETEVQISVGDPRGAFAFRVWRYTDPQTGEQGLRLSLPYPGQGTPHMRLQEVYPGTYDIL